MKPYLKMLGERPAVAKVNADRKPHEAAKAAAKNVLEGLLPLSGYAPLLRHARRRSSIPFLAVPIFLTLTASRSAPSARGW